MNTAVLVQCPVIVAAMIGASLAQASTLTRDDYNAEKARIAHEYTVEDSRCGVLAGHAKDECASDARFNEKVALANLEYRFTGSKSDERRYVAAKEQADTAVAREKCEAVKAGDKVACMKQAGAGPINAPAQATKGKLAGDTRSDASKSAQGPDYALALKRCDSFDGETKSACIISVKAKFGKS